MQRLKKIRWLPEQESKVHATTYKASMWVLYFVTMLLFGLVFLIPSIRRLTGIEPWEYAILGAMHFVSSLLPQLLFRKMNMTKFMLWGFFSDKFIASSVALFGAPDATFLWIFFTFMCIAESLSTPRNAYSALLILLTPLLTWAAFISAEFRQFSWHDFSVVITVSAITLIWWLMFTEQMVQYRKAHRDVETSNAQAELERSRAELSRDIHDAIAAIFTRILAVQKDEHGETATLTRDGLHQLRDIVTALQAENTSLEFLASWLNQYSQHYFERTDIHCHFTAECESPDLTLEPVRIIHVMRIFQELCQNALKHSQASEVKTFFQQKQNQVVVEFSDNGPTEKTHTGLHSAETKNPSGLKNMQERASELGGTIDHIENPLGGLKTRIVFPV